MSFELGGTVLKGKMTVLDPLRWKCQVIHVKLSSKPMEIWVERSEPETGVININYS